MLLLTKQLGKYLLQRFSLINHTLVEKQKLIVYHVRCIDQSGYFQSQDYGGRYVLAIYVARTMHHVQIISRYLSRAEFENNLIHHAAYHISSSAKEWTCKTAKMHS